MKIEAAPLPGVFIIYPKIIGDQRGYFFESYRKDLIEKAGMKTNWVQENQSFSKKGTVRGLHFQKAPHSQAKLVKVVSGKVLDVCVDLRKDSPNFGQTFSVILDDQAHGMLYVPEGFGHGFSALEDAVFSYRCNNLYHRESEGGVIWDDPFLDIDWMVQNPIISEKDAGLPSLEEFKNANEGGL